MDRAVASDSRGPRFESSHRPKLLLNVYCQLYRKDENKEKGGRESPIQKDAGQQKGDNLQPKLSIEIRNKSV